MSGFWRMIGSLMGKTTASTATTAYVASQRGKVYSLGLVGERAYQAAIGKCRAGEPVTLIAEPDNPYDDRAIAAITATGATIGYVPRDSWIGAAIHDEGKGAWAAIKSMAAGSSGNVGVVLEVRLCAGPIGERAFAAR